MADILGTKKADPHWGSAFCHSRGLPLRGRRFATPRRISFAEGSVVVTPEASLATQRSVVVTFLSALPAQIGCCEFQTAVCSHCTSPLVYFCRSF